MELKAKFKTSIPMIKGNRLLPSQDCSRDLSTGVIKRIQTEKVSSNWLKFKQKSNNKPQGEITRATNRYPTSTEPPNSKSMIQKMELNFTGELCQKSPLKSDRVGDCSSFSDIKNTPGMRSHSQLQDFNAQSVYNSNIIHSEQQIYQGSRITTYDISNKEFSFPLLESSKNKFSRNLMMKAKDQQSPGKKNQRYTFVEQEVMQMKDKLKIAQEGGIKLKIENGQLLSKLKDMEIKIKIIEEKSAKNNSDLNNLQIRNRKSEESLRISRNIIANLNQKLIVTLKNHDNTIKTNNQEFNKKIEQIKVSVELKEKDKYDAIIKTLEKTIFELKLKLIDEANANDEIIIGLRELNQKHESDKNTLLEQVNNLKNILLNNQNDLKNLNQQFLILDQENKHFYNQNLHLFEENNNLKEQIKHVNAEHKKLQSKPSLKLQAKIIQMKEKLQNQKIEHFNEIKKLNEVLMTKQNNFLELKMKMLHQDEQNRSILSEKDIKLQIMRKQLQMYQSQNELLQEQKLQQKNMRTDALKIRNNQINQLEKQVKRLTLDIALKKQINSNNDNQIEMLKGQLSKLREQISNYKLQAASKEQIAQQKQIQLSIRQKQFQQLENEYRQILADEIKKISEMYDETNENKLKSSEADHSKKISSTQRKKKSIKSSINKDSENNDSFIFDEEIQDKEKLFRRIEDLTYINHALNDKVQEIKEIEEKSDKLILAKIKQFEIYLWQSEKHKEQFEESYLQMSEKVTQLSKKCQVYKAKIQQMKQNYKQLESYLHETTEQLMRSRINMMQFKFTQKELQPKSQEELLKLNQIHNKNQNDTDQQVYVQNVQNILKIEQYQIIEPCLDQEQQGYRQQKIKLSLQPQQEKNIQDNLQDLLDPLMPQNEERKQHQNIGENLKCFQVTEDIEKKQQQQQKYLSESDKRGITQTKEVEQDHEDQFIYDYQIENEMKQSNVQKIKLQPFFSEADQYTQPTFDESQQGKYIITPENEPISNTECELNQDVTISKELHPLDNISIAQDIKQETLNSQDLCDQ